MTMYQKNITREEVLRLATVAQLALDAGEAEALAADLSATLAAFGNLETVTGSEPIAEGAPLVTLRADREEQSLSREAVLANAADRTDAAIAVPRVVE